MWLHRPTTQATNHPLPTQPPIYIPNWSSVNTAVLEGSRIIVPNHRQQMVVRMRRERSELAVLPTAPLKCDGATKEPEKWSPHPAVAVRGSKDTHGSGGRRKLD